MSLRLSAIWRHPIKSHGRERIGTVRLNAGEAMPNDRRWAVLHDAARQTGEGWLPCQSFQRGSRVPALAAIWAEFDDGEERLTLRHPDLGEISFHPDDAAEAERFLAWSAPLAEANGTNPRALYALPQRGYTDTDYASVSILNLASHRAVEAAMGRRLEPERWRCNLWIDGAAPWDESAWPGREITIGAVRLRIEEPIVRCRATEADPKTGQRNAPTLQTLNSEWDHQNFGVYARVVEGGELSEGDVLKVEE